jgi:hypothetical protein
MCYKNKKRSGDGGILFSENAKANQPHCSALIMRAAAGMLISIGFSAIFLSLFRWTNELYNNADRR